jgi:hypothetical protein
MATSSITNTISLIQTVAAGITGVKSAPTTFPSKLDRPQLPYVLTFPEAATTSQSTFQQTHRTTIRDYSVRCYVEAIGQNITTNRIATAITLLQLFIEEFETNRELLAGITIIDSINDSGIITGGTALTSGLIKMNLADTLYTGFFLTLKVREYYSL